MNISQRIAHESGLRELVNRSVIGDSRNPLRAWHREGEIVCAESNAWWVCLDQPHLAFSWEYAIYPDRRNALSYSAREWLRHTERSARALQVVTRVWLVACLHVSSSERGAVQTKVHSVPLKVQTRANTPVLLILEVRCHRKAQQGSDTCQRGITEFC